MHNTTSNNMQCHLQQHVILPPTMCNATCNDMQCCSTMHNAMTMHKAAAYAECTMPPMLQHDAHNMQRTMPMTPLAPISMPPHRLIVAFFLFVWCMLLLLLPVFITSGIFPEALCQSVLESLLILFWNFPDSAEGSSWLVIFFTSNFHSDTASKTLKENPN